MLPSRHLPGPACLPALPGGRGAVPCCAAPRCATPGCFDLAATADPVLGVGLGRDRNRKVQRAGSWGRQGARAGREPWRVALPLWGEWAAWLGGFVTPHIPGEGRFPGTRWLMLAIAQARRDLAPVWDAVSAGGVVHGGRDAFASCSQPSRQRHGGKLGAVAWNGPAGVSSGFITLPVAAGQR